MSLSIQTNVASLTAQNFIRVNSAFQSTTIQRLSSGYRITASADDAAGLAVANKYRGDTAELTQGVLNANTGVSSLQIVDGGVNNISNILDRLRTLATESASQTFTGDRGTLDTEYQGLLREVDRQAANVKLNTGGTFNTNLVTYVGGGSNQTNAQVAVDLSGSNNAVDGTALGISTTSIAGGGSQISGNTVRLDNTAAAFLTSTSQSFTFHLNTGTGNQDITTTVTGGSGGLSGTQVIANLNTSLQAYGITASIGSNGNPAIWRPQRLPSRQQRPAPGRFPTPAPQSTQETTPLAAAHSRLSQTPAEPRLRRASLSRMRPRHTTST